MLYLNFSIFNDLVNRFLSAIPKRGLHFKIVNSLSMPHLEMCLFWKSYDMLSLDPRLEGFQDIFACEKRCDAKNQAFKIA